MNSANCLQHSGLMESTDSLKEKVRNMDQAIIRLDEKLSNHITRTNQIAIAILTLLSTNLVAIVIVCLKVLN